jgi:hypothetical protein
MAVKKNGGASAGAVSRTLTLDPGTAYFYEYETRGLGDAGAAEKPVISYGTPATGASPDAQTNAGGGYVRHTGSFTTPPDLITVAVTLTLTGAADEWAVRDMRVYRLNVDGQKVYVSENLTDSAARVAAWNATGATAVSADERPDSGETEKGAMVYKKGDLVLYSIFYTDYENDRSGAGFWAYTHTPFSDGEHPDAAVIKNMNGDSLKITGKVFSENIERFYINGKYTAEHWQRDDTDRTGAGNGQVNYGDYNRLSNTETVTFYIEGGGNAPWVTDIKTNPDPVNEGAGYTLTVGVDDAEKDDLNVLVEVYYEGKEVYRYYEENVQAGPTGSYPPVVTGFAPPAASGDYNVVATVSDKDGAGLGNHEFTVIFLGRITGAVHHTDQWDANRQKYNNKLFGDPYNGISAFPSYSGQPAPRKRGANVFWSGERFMLRAPVGGNPLSVTCQIEGYPSYAAAMTATGEKNDGGDTVHTGNIWKDDMINKWGKTAPAELRFVFTATYAGGTEKTAEATVIVDTYEDYWRLHRNF